MTWVRIDDGMPDSLKVAPLSDAAFRAYITSICYCARSLTDGFVPAKKAKEFSGRPRVVQELANAGLWDAEEGGYRVHDYLVYNPSREQVEAERGIAKRRHAMNADPEFARRVKERDENRCRYCGLLVNWRDRKSGNGGTYDHVIPIVQGGDEDFDNLVVCCRSCNFKKGARTPEQAGMILRQISSKNLDGIKPILRQPVPRSRSPIPNKQDRDQETSSDPADAIAIAFGRFGRVNAGTASAIDETIRDYGIEWTQLAVKRAQGSGFEGSPPWSYVDSICERWQKIGGPQNDRQLQITSNHARRSSRNGAGAEPDATDAWQQYVDRFNADNG